jgi:GTPase Era involved in 16S rRNA processing
MSICKIPVSIGELWDKYTILLIKKTNIKNKTNLNHVLTEIKYLEPFLEIYKISDKIFNELKDCNDKLWNILAEQREKDRNKQFDQEFIELSKMVYYTNDERVAIKNRINALFNSGITEVKSYKDHE